MTDRTSDPATLHTRLHAWVTDHDSPTRWVPAHIALRLGTLTAIDALTKDGLLEPTRLGWQVRQPIEGTHERTPK